MSIYGDLNVLVRIVHLWPPVPNDRMAQSRTRLLAAEQAWNNADDRTLPLFTCEGTSDGFHHASTTAYQQMYAQSSERSTEWFRQEAVFVARIAHYANDGPPFE